MPEPDIHDYIILGVLLIAWCSLHSAMISITLTRFLQNRFAEKYRYYRLLFNFIAIATLLPLAIFAFSLESETLFDWDGYMRIPQLVLLALGVLLFFLGASKYDARRFLGLAQLKESGSSKGLTASGDLDTSGILNVIRHPWYSALILILWARPLDGAALTVNIVFTAYLLIGARLEEKKLIHEFGNTYRQYRQNVSMLFPYKWLKNKLAG